jgi:hypothetical protein
MHGPFGYRASGFSQIGGIIGIGSSRIIHFMQKKVGVFL